MNFAERATLLCALVRLCRIGFSNTSDDPMKRAVVRAVCDSSATGSATGMTNGEACTVRASESQLARCSIGRREATEFEHCRDRPLKDVAAKFLWSRGSENGQLIRTRKEESERFTLQPRSVRKKDDYMPRTWAAQTILRSRCWSTRTARYREQVAISAFAQLAMAGISRPSFCTTA